MAMPNALFVHSTQRPDFGKVIAKVPTNQNSTPMPIA